MGFVIDFAFCLADGGGFLEVELRDETETVGEETGELAEEERDRFFRVVDGDAREDEEGLLSPEEREEGGIDDEEEALLGGRLVKESRFEEVDVTEEFEVEDCLFFIDDGAGFLLDVEVFIFSSLSHFFSALS